MSDYSLSETCVISFAILFELLFVFSSNIFLNMSWKVAIWKNGNFDEVDGVLPSKWINKKEKILW